MSVLDGNSAEAPAPAISTTARKRRRWSTVQEDGLPKGLGGTLRIAGRHSASNPLASFNFQSNPMFEPAPLSSAGSRILARPCTRSAMRGQSRLGNPTTTNPTSRGSVVAAGEQRLSAAKRLCPRKKGRPEPRLVADDFDWRKIEDLMECGSPVSLKLSANGGSQDLMECGSHVSLKVSTNGGSEDLMECGSHVSLKVSTDGGSSQVLPTEDAIDKGGWQEAEDHFDKVILPPSAPALTSSCGQLTSIESDLQVGRVFQQIEADSTESGPRLSGDHAIPELVQLRTNNKAMIDQLKADLTEHEVAARRCIGTAGKLLSVLDENNQLQFERNTQKNTEEKLRLDLIVVKKERDAKTIAERDSKLMLEALAIERDYWKQQAQRLDRDRGCAVVAVTSQRDKQNANAEAGRRNVEGNEDDVHIEAEVTGEPATTGSLLNSVYLRSEDGQSCNLSKESNFFANIEDPQLETVNFKSLDGQSSPRGCSLNGTFEKLLQAQLSAVHEEMAKLKRERDDLRDAVLDGERKMEETQKERDAVCLAVKSEREVFQGAMQIEKERLKSELQSALDEKARLEAELDSLRVVLQMKSKSLESELQVGREATQRLKDERDRLSTTVRDLRATLKEQSNALSMVRAENTKLSGEVGQVRHEMKTPGSERKPVANHKVECESTEKIKPESSEQEERNDESNKEEEREILIAMQTYLKKLANKRVQIQTDQDEVKNLKKPATKRARKQT